MSADPREAEELEREKEYLAKGRCPATGLVLHREGEAGPHAASCDMCDCFGYNPDKVKVWPRPLNVVRWKVTRMRCLCGRSYTGDKWSTMCPQCGDDAFPDFADNPFGVSVGESLEEKP